MAEETSLFSDGFKSEPFWWEDAPRPAGPGPRLPATADVLVIGSGYTGLQAALQTARAGRATVVVDAQCAGFGCSSRNGGHVSTSIKPDFQALERRHGRDLAYAIRTEGASALAYIDEFIRTEQIECDWARVGRFYGAHKPASYEALSRAIQRQPSDLRIEAHMVPRAEQHTEIGSDLYHGGAVFPDVGALHPGQYHLGLLQRAQEASAQVVSQCRVSAIEAARSGYLVHTSKGLIQARDVVLASNGYTGPLSPWQRRRIIPIGSYMIATEPLDPLLIETLSPNNRVMSDTRKLVFYYRASPDRRRILFGGRVALMETDPRASAPRLHAAMCKIFPQLQATRVSHSWVGFVAYTFDTLPHVGVHEGMHYAMGYCGSGVSLGSYLGMRLGQKVIGSSEGATALDAIAFPTRPLYSGNPWFLAPSILYYQLRDRMNF